MRYRLKVNKSKMYKFVKAMTGLELPAMKFFDFKHTGNSYWLDGSTYSFYLSSVCGSPLLRIQQLGDGDCIDRVQSLTVKSLLDFDMLGVCG